MTREELRDKVRREVQDRTGFDWDLMPGMIPLCDAIIALVVEACCAEIESFCFTVRETGDQALTRHLKATFLPTEKPDA